MPGSDAASDAPPVSTRVPGVPSRLRLGLLGLIPVTLAVVLLGFLPGKPEALTTTITAITFGLPFLIAATLWWEGWPFRGWSRGAAGWARMALLVVLTVAATIVGQAVTGGVDLGGIVGSAGSFGIFPYGFVLAASIFAAMLQTTFVTDKMPFRRLGPVAGGFAAIGTAWALGLAQYFLLLHWPVSAGQPAAPPLGGVGPVAALDWPPVLLCMVVLQLVFFVLWRGWPFSRIRDDRARFVVVNLFTVGGGILLNAVLRWAGIPDARIAAVCGAIAAATILVVILFDGWPSRGLAPHIDRLVGFAVVAMVSAALVGGLHLIGGLDYPETPAVPPIDLWVAGVCLNLVAAFSIVHVAVFDRWPFRKAHSAARDD